MGKRQSITNWGLFFLRTIGVPSFLLGDILPFTIGISKENVILSVITAFRIRQAEQSCSFDFNLVVEHTQHLAPENKETRASEAA